MANGKYLHWLLLTETVTAILLYLPSNYPVMSIHLYFMVSCFWWPVLIKKTNTLINKVDKDGLKLKSDIIFY